jgi:predicted heme/steroid binding protein
VNFVVRPRYRVAITIASALLGLGSVAGALAYVQSSPAGAGTRKISREVLAQHDGIDGHQCYVAVDGTVYLIEGFALWTGGTHVTSGGKARCGQDLSQVINESPHGKSKLQLLKVVGKLDG